LRPSSRALCQLPTVMTRLHSRWREWVPRSNSQLPERRLKRSSRLAVAAILGVAACVSLSPPNRGGGGNVPVVRGVYKPGSEQIVRIALETSAKELPAGMGTGSVVQPDVSGFV